MPHRKRRPNNKKRAARKDYRPTAATAYHFTDSRGRAKTLVVRGEQRKIIEADLMANVVLTLGHELQAEARGIVADQETSREML